MSNLTIELADDLHICRVLNGMWQISGGHGQINKESALLEMLKYHNFGFTTWDLADIYGLLIFQDGLDTRSAYNYLTNPSLGPWLGEFYKPGAHDMEEARLFILGAQLDTNEVLRGVFRRYGRRYYDSLLGSKPNGEDMEDVLGMLMEAAEKETDPDVKLILEDIQRDYREIFSFRPSGLAERIRR